MSPFTAGPQTFLGQKYGYRPFPAKIDATEFDRLLAGVSDAEDKSLLNYWFYRDDNSVPAVYVLQPITVHLPHFSDNENNERRKAARTKWWKSFEAMQMILRHAASKQLDKQEAGKYFMSGECKAGECRKKLMEIVKGVALEWDSGVLIEVGCICTHFTACQQDVFVTGL